MSDEFGNDVNAVGIPVTGAIALAPEGTDGPTRAEGADPEFKLSDAFRRVGLVTQDGGPEFTEERDGDPIQFWQDGYTIPTGLSNCTVTFTAAETNAFIIELHAGKEPDEYGYVEINAGGHAKVYTLWMEEIFQNGMIRRRIAHRATVEAFKIVKSERGSVLGYEITLRIGVSPKLNNNHYGQWVFNPSLEPAPTVASAAPVSGAVGVEVTLTGTGFNSVTAVRFGDESTTAFTKVSDTSIKVKVPTGLAPGSHPIRVVRGATVSASIPFTVAE